MKEENKRILIVFLIMIFIGSSVVTIMYSFLN